MIYLRSLSAVVVAPKYFTRFTFHFLRQRIQSMVMLFRFVVYIHCYILSLLIACMNSMFTLAAADTPFHLSPFGRQRAVTCTRMNQILRLLSLIESRWPWKLVLQITCSPFNSCVVKELNIRKGTSMQLPYCFPSLLFIRCPVAEAQGTCRKSHL